MNKRLALPLVVFALASPSVIMAQHPEERSHGQESRSAEHERNTPRANQGRIPPAPVRREPSTEVREERHENGKVNGWQHVNHDQWFGHDRPDDRRFHVDHPFEHGHFAHFGPNYRYRVLRIDGDHHRFWFPGGFYFQVADWDWATCADWCWTCGDDFVVYEDPDHDGWYLLYNVHTGLYVHVTYLGS
jgi:hypothetical protein